MTELLVLNLLLDGAARTDELVVRAGAHDRRVGRPAIVAATTALRADGFVTGRTPDGGAHTLTAAGRVEFERRVVVLLRAPGGSALRYLSALGRDAVAAALRTRVERLRERIERLAAQHPAVGDSPLERAEADYHLHMYEADVVWTERVLDGLGHGIAALRAA